MTPTRLSLTGLLALFAFPLLAADPPRLELKPSDRIAVIGNTLADRMQHDAWLDAFLHTRFPTLDLAFRHMGFSADEVGGFSAKPDFHQRLRSADFGSNDEWMTRVKADVVFAFFGYNESFAGKEGIDAFKKSLDGFVKHTLTQKYNGRSAPRLVLFSPIAQEPPKGRRLPDPAKNNERLQLYTAAIAEVAAANAIPFVDLFKPTSELFARETQPLTINGIHPSPDGYRELSRIIDQSLFGGDGTRDTALLEKVRKAAMDRNFTWYQRYRTTDGYSIYGGRADLKFTHDQTNRVVAQRELEILDVMTANRDKVVWSAAKNQDAKPDDSKTPPFIPVITNKPGAGPNGKHLFFTGEEAISKMTVGKGLQINLFADESMFPELVNPVQMAWDTKGRLWVATWPTYPHWTPKGAMNDKLLIFEDTNADGKADKMTVFADDLHNPTGFEFVNGGVLVAQAPDLVLLKDTNGDDKADTRERVLSGLDTADTHHTSNSFVLDPGGALYFQEGTFHHTQVESPYGPPRRVANGSVFRYEPRTQKFDVYVSYGFANPHGHVFDRWGQDIVVDGTGAVPYHGPLFSGHLPYPQKHAKPPQVYEQRTRPCGGMEFVYSKHFPDEFWGNLFVTNVIGFQGLLRYKIEDSGSSLKGTELEPIVSSSDPNFRPVDVKTGPDGAVYFVDWHNPIIGHMQHNLRDPSRDREHGRIYRISYQGREPVKPVKIAGEPVPVLLDLLKAPEDRVRYRARIELATRDWKEIQAALENWGPRVEKELKGEDLEHALLEALWLHQSFDVVNYDLLKRMLQSPDFRARSAAVRVLCAWRERRSETLDWLRRLAADEHPRVRLMALWAASYLTEPEAIEVVVIAAEKPRDQYLDFLSGETMKALTPVVSRALAGGKELKFTTPAGARYFLRIAPTDLLLKLPRTPDLFAELLLRPGVRDEARQEAVAGLAAERKQPAIRILLEAFRGLDRGKADETVVFDLARLITARPAELNAGRAELESIAASAKNPLLRQLAFVALIAADGSAERSWALAANSVTGLRDFVIAVPQIRDPNQRAALYPRLAELVAGLPKELAAKYPKAGEIHGRYVRIELPGKQKTLTLAEVEVRSDDRNIARTGKASQSSTAHGGKPERAIDGNTSGSYSNGGQTHTTEGQANPWWELDLGAVYPIDTIDIYNRTDGNLSNRLNNFTLKVLDPDRKVVFERAKNKAPNGKETYVVGGEATERIVRRSAMLALTSIRGKETETFKLLAPYVKSSTDRAGAVTAIQRLPIASWPQEDAAALLETITAAVAKVPVKERTTPEVLDAMQFAYSLTGLLPRDKARAARAALGALGVRVIRVGTLTDQMLFDKDRIIAEAGKPVEFVLDNTDIMPHNFVITRMGALEEVGNAAEAFGTQPGAQQKHFVPPSDKILLSSKLLQPRESQKLAFTAPTEPGVYPYVCTYPGHWRRMHGALYVVPSLDDYLEDPEKYLTANAIPVRDELLKFNRPRTEWKYEELSPTVAELDRGGRSFAHGKQMFTVATCIACHKFDGQGQEFGPDLTKLDPKVFVAPKDMLEHLLDPSKRIEDKYRSFTFNLLAGGTLTGMVLEKTPTAYKVIENPLAKAEARTIPAADLEGDPKPSPSSIMPKGLLDKLTKDEILDLVAYVLAKGDPKHKYFQGGHDHGGHKH